MANATIVLVVVLEKEIGIAFELGFETLPPPIKDIGGDGHGLVPPGTTRVEGEHKIIEVLGNLLRHQWTFVGCCRRRSSHGIVSSNTVVVVAAAISAAGVCKVSYDLYRFDGYPKVDPYGRWRLLPIEPDEFLPFGPTRPEDIRLSFRRNQRSQKLESGLLLLVAAGNNLHLPIDQEAGIERKDARSTGEQEKDELVDGRQGRGKVSRIGSHRESEFRVVGSFHRAKVRADGSRCGDQAKERLAQLLLLLR